MIDRPSLRHAYVEAEVSTALAHQIRVLRQQRGWSQKELARRLGTTQAAVSRLEDPSYGKLSIKTLMHLSQVFDTGLEVRFVSLVEMLARTWKPSPQAMRVPAFDDEAPKVGFHSTPTSGRADMSLITMLTPCGAGPMVARTTGACDTVYELGHAA